MLASVHLIEKLVLKVMVSRHVPQIVHGDLVFPPLLFICIGHVFREQLSNGGAQIGRASDWDPKDEGSIPVRGTRTNCEFSES